MLHDPTSLLTSGLTFGGIGILLLAAAHDLIARSVPDWMSILLAAIGLGERLIDGRVVAGLCAALIVFAIAALCWRRGWLGGGDVKLLGAATLMLSPALAPLFLLAVTIAGGLLALIYLALHRMVPAAVPSTPLGHGAGLLARALRAERWRINRGAPLPYVCAIAAGFTFVSI